MEPYLNVNEKFKGKNNIKYLLILIMLIFIKLLQLSKQLQLHSKKKILRNFFFF